MTKRFVVYNSFAPIKKVATRDLKRGDVIFGTGETVAGFARNRTNDGRVHVVLSKGGYRRIAHWAADTLVGAIEKPPVKPVKTDTDTVGDPKEIAYGEGWHSKENYNPYTDPEQRAAWERGRKAYKQKTSLKKHSAYQGPAGAGMKRKVSFEQPTPRDYQSEKGYVGKIINAKTGGVLARSEPFISQNSAKNWLRSKAQEFINAGKRVSAEIALVAFDPNKGYDAIRDAGTGMWEVECVLLPSVAKKEGVSPNQVEAFSDAYEARKAFLYYKRSGECSNVILKNPQGQKVPGP